MRPLPRFRLWLLNIQAREQARRLNSPPIYPIVTLPDEP